MARHSTLGFVLLVAALFAACDKGGVYPLGVSKDVIVQCDVQSTWLRSIEGATEVFVIGSDDFSTLDAQLADGTAVCFNFATVQYNSTTQLFSGRLRAGSGGGYQVDIVAEYNFKYEPEKNIVLRSGARRVDYDPPIVIRNVAFTTDGSSLIVDYDSTQRRLTRIGEIITRLDPEETDPDAPGGPKDAYRVFNLALFVGQPRIPGFGGTGMTQYTTKTTFNALISGYFTINVTSIASPHVYIDYYGAQELEGIFITGLQITRATLQGEGPMEGVLDIEMFVDSDDETPDIKFTIDYENLVVGNGVADSGYYILTYDGGAAHELPFSMATDEDLRGILPIADGIP
jgi:hypothetical protein